MKRATCRCHGAPAKPQLSMTGRSSSRRSSIIFFGARPSSRRMPSFRIHRIDKQAKSLGEYLRAKYIEVPDVLAAGIG